MRTRSEQAAAYPKRERLELSGARHDPANLVALVGTTGPVWLTMVNGEARFRDGELIGVDERDLAHRAEAAWAEGISRYF